MANAASKFIALLLAGTLVLAACGDNGDVPQDAGTDAIVVPDIKLSFEQLLQACIGLGACGIARYPRLSNCVNAYHTVLSQSGQRTLYAVLYDCINKAKGNCKQIYQCMGFAERPQDPKLSCDTSTYKSKCDGTVARNCFSTLNQDGWRQGIDCAKGGLKCAIKDSGGGKLSAICGAGTCNPKTHKSVCKDNKHFKCVGGAIEVDDCTAQFLQCRDSNAGCEGKGRSTKKIDGVCKGNVLTQSKNNFLWEVDCTKLHGQKVCDSVSNECKGGGKQCSEDAFFDACDPGLTKIVTCIDGNKKEIDCKALGYLGCKVVTKYSVHCHPESVFN